MNEPDLTLVVFALNEIEGLKAVGPRINTQKKFLKSTRAEFRKVVEKVRRFSL